MSLTGIPRHLKSILRVCVPGGRQRVVCFSGPHDCYTFMKHLFSKSIELALKALLLSAGKYQLLISACLYLSRLHLLEDSRPILVLIFLPFTNRWTALLLSLTSPSEGFYQRTDDAGHYRVKFSFSGENFRITFVG